ncbi:MAG TPA: DUF1549 domain-containing protein, partial [Pirellulaceae bacterium]|nr:DUF1549 domain-containing protein [Pirellulaceae bacterium]
HSGSEPQGELDLSQQLAAFKGGESGAAVVAGDLDKSLLWQKIIDGEMPPKKPLPEAERALLKEWISSGAKWGTPQIDAFRYTTDVRAGYDWWSLQPIVRPTVPVVAHTWDRANPIDAFVQAKLSAAGLNPSPIADKRALIRRLTFDLLGLPPTPAETQAFLDDSSPDATARLIARLLASPHYGERWARHWLDVIRFGESQGFERDKLRTNSWRYRDWVIDAFNRDLPYQTFVRQQLAGDIVAPKDPATIAATGFLVAGPFDEVGKTQQSAAMKAVVRQDELEDFVSVVGQTFLGLTVNCARCHDHKFDPIRQREYYQLAATMAGVEHGQRGLPAEAIQATLANSIAALRAQQQALTQGTGKREAEIRARLLAASKQQGQKQPPPVPLAEWLFESDTHDLRGKLAGELQGTAKLSAGQLHLDGKSAYLATVPLEQDLAAKTLVAWVRLADLKQRGGGVISVQTTDGSQFDAIVFGEQEPGRWMAGSDTFKRTKSFSGADETTAEQRAVQVAIVYSADGTITAYRDGQRYGTPYKSSGLVTFKRGAAHVVFGLRHGPPGGNKMLSGDIERAALFDRALSPEEVAALAGVEINYVPDSEVLAELAHLNDLIKRWEDRTTYAVTPKAPHPVHLLARGEPNKPLEEVVPGGIASLVGVSADFQLSAQANDAERRQKLADWITATNNPLAARVLVNRLWHYHFGVGLVDTPNDFGFNGGRPSHPELLDWLAAEFLANHGSVKHIQQLIVSSSTYQQASLPNAAAIAKDADNRWLWRHSPARLDAEMVRDALLAASGALNTELAGPGFADFRTFVANSQFYEMLDPVGHSFHRRTVYRTWIRSGRSPLLDVFDCPDPSTKTPTRAVTTTPLQALSLLNNSLVLRLSDATAERVRRETNDDPQQQVPRLYVILFGRTPSDSELKLTVPFAREHGLSALARVLFNSNEFLHID